MSNAYDQTDGYDFNKEYTLKIRLEGFYRGRSAVVHEFKDENDKTLHFSAKGVYLFFEKLADKEITIDDKGFFNGTFIMKKQGSSARWQPKS